MWFKCKYVVCKASTKISVQQILVSPLLFCFFDEKRGKKMIDLIHCSERLLECQSDAGIRSQELRKPIFLSKRHVKFNVYKSFIYKTLFAFLFLGRRRADHILLVSVITGLLNG